ncbi:MAG: hypothetical protein JSV89_14900 [Spirochaetaceae bacterium]|nr:MAG: hypothetical protein JSV89_14900 [Spirochaetaceae bacterium]
MDLFRSLRILGLKSILSSALTLEQEIYNLYSSLKAELTGLEVPPSLVRILDEELGHQQLIRDMKNGHLAEEEIERILGESDLRIHEPASIDALPADRYGPLLKQIEAILEKEEEIHRLFAGLHRKAKIPFVRRAFRFLEEQERIHLRVLERLLGRTES